MWVFRCRYWEASPRFVAELSGMLFDGAVGNPRRDAHRVPAIARVERSSEPRPVTIAESRPLADLFALELGERGECRKQSIADELVFCGQVLFRERPKCDAMRGQALQMSDSR